VILDHVCALQTQREVINPDILIYMQGTNPEWEHAHGWETPNMYDFCFDTASPDNVQQVLRKVATKRVVI
jgi:hypothetical protein